MSDTSCLAYLLSRHTVVQWHVLLKMSLEDKAATKQGIFTTCIAIQIAGAERDTMTATLSANFWDEHGECVCIMFSSYFISVSNLLILYFVLL